MTIPMRTRLNKNALVRLLLDYQWKFNYILDDLKNNFDEGKAKFTNLETDLNISTYVNSKLSDGRINLERKSFASESNILGENV